MEYWAPPNRGFEKHMVYHRVAVRLQSITKESSTLQREFQLARTHPRHLPPPFHPELRAASTARRAPLFGPGSANGTTHT